MKEQNSCQLKEPGPKSFQMGVCSLIYFNLKHLTLVTSFGSKVCIVIRRWSCGILPTYTPAVLVILSSAVWNQEISYSSFRVSKKLLDEHFIWPFAYLIWLMSHLHRGGGVFNKYCNQPQGGIKMFRFHFWGAAMWFIFILHSLASLITLHCLLQHRWQHVYDLFDLGPVGITLLICLQNAFPHPLPGGHLTFRVDSPHEAG